MLVCGACQTGRRRVVDGVRHAFPILLGHEAFGIVAAVGAVVAVGNE
ncbi:alcohol dehydrogenase catalytic domain-containing protein [Kocuria turfanensis]|uniref:Uncharacterized protein n=1 Tax=Kocuria turfanensis TaxID=388357 RepID=A0A512IHB5_9MICC|nr:alcohol dehydrogenase catalytic domain-containing protein [Kocuria turfanensis]GEO97047.1 hypothetical protein KTU01_31700 [Kocuria turfanensis]